MDLCNGNSTAFCRTRPPKIGNEECKLICGYKSLVRRNNCMHVGCKAPSPWLCQPISEEPESVEFEEFKRHHRHRPPRNRYLNQFIFKYISYSSTSMSLRPESFNARVRGTSHIDFKTATTGVAAKSMRNELSRLVSTIDDPVAKKVHFPNLLSVLSNPPLSRLSIPKCNTFFTSSLVTSQSVLKMLICTSISSRLILFYSNHPVTGTVSNLQLKTRSFPMPTFQNQLIQKTSASWLFSKSTVVSVLRWVRSSQSPSISSYLLIFLLFRNDRCQECSRGQRRHDFP